MKLEMKALEWRDPLSNAQVEAAEKALARQRKAERAAKKHEKAVEREKSRLARIQLAKTGRLRVEEKQNEYFAALKLDVAKLEAKKTGQTPAKLIAKHDKERVSKQAEEREEMVLKETKLTAEEMLKVRERELEEKRRRQEKEIADLAERRRRELLEYKHSLGLLSSPHPASRPSRFPDRPASLHDDPEFWRLSMEDRYAIELMDPGERAERCGLGPYEEDEREWDPELHERFEQLGIGQAKMHELKGAEAAEKKLLEKMKQFICTEQPNVPGVLRRFPSIDLSLPLTFTYPDVYDPADRPAVVDLLREHQQYVRDDLVRHAIEQFGANALLEMRLEGPVDVEPQEGDEEVIAELRATGVPVRLDPHALASLLCGKGIGKLFAGGGKARQHPKQHNAWSSTGWNNDAGGWDDPAAVDAGVGDGWATGATNWGAGGGGGGGWRAPMAGAGGGGEWSTGVVDPWTTQGGNGAGGWGAGGGRGWKGKGREQNGGWGGTMGGGGEVGWGTGGKGHWGGGGGWGQGDGVWGQAASQQQHPQAPPEVRNLPFGAQIYIKRMREQQEREAREAALHSMNPHLHPQQPPPAQTPFVASSAAVAREDAAIFGNAFARSAFPSSPFIPASHDPVPTVAAQQATVDPDHGGQGWRAGAGAGGATDGGGWEQPTAAEVSQGVTPAAENGWKGTQPW